MNVDKLKQAEHAFFSKYPGGFEHPDLVAIGKKHKMSKMIDFATDHFDKEAFENQEQLLENLSKVVSRSSMVSLFEKPKFRDFIYELSIAEKEPFIAALYDLLHGNMRKGFEAYCKVLRDHKLAKWSLMTILLAYYRPNKEVFVKPTTAKGVIAHFDIDELIYKPQPSWDFYNSYRDSINTAKGKVDPSLSPSNAAFCGFLMMSLPT